MTLKSLIFKNDARSLAKRVANYVALFQKIFDIPVYDLPSFFRIDSVHQMETSLSHA
jgi:hypothetical protein